MRYHFLHHDGGIICIVNKDALVDPLPIVGNAPSNQLKVTPQARP
jgi:hypothetical protein